MEINKEKGMPPLTAEEEIMIIEGSTPVLQGDA